MIRTVLNPFCLISILLIAVCLNLSNAQNEDLPKFTNVQTETGIQSVGGMGQSATWGDYNVDGWPDIFLSNMDRNIRGKRRRSLRGNSGSINSSIDQYQIQTSFLFLNEEGQFKEVSRYLGIPNSHYINATWADYDNDGFLDLALGTISSAAPLKLYKNMDSVYFIDVSADAGIIEDSVVTHGIWADYDNDGNVDLFQVSTGVSFLYKNKGNGTFEEISERAGLGELLSTNSALWFDSNNDGYQDLLLLNSGMNIMYLNNRDGTFLDITESSGLGGRQLWKTTSACSGDYNGDGYFDIYLTNIGRASGNALYRNNGDGTFTNITWNTNTDDVGDGRTCAWIDFDADGKIDLFSTNHVNPNRLYRNIGNDVFVDVASLVGIDYPMDVFAASWGDYNRDGFVDVFLNGHLGTALMKNSGNANNSVTLNLIGSGLLSNSSAIGARVEVISAEGIQVREVSGGRGCCEQDMLPVYFGVGQDKTIGVNVKWPSGRTCSFKELSLEKVNHFTIHEIKCDIIPSNKIAN